MSDPAETRAVGHGYVLDVATLLRRPGDRARLVLDEDLDGLATSTAEATTLRGELVVEAMSDSISVAGTVELGFSGDCRRCLEPAVGSAAVDVQEVYERHPVEGETYALADDHVDVEPMLRELALLSLPLAPLCDDGCQGPDPERFPAEVAPDPEDAAEPAPDPRWAALDDLVFDD